MKPKCRIVLSVLVVLAGQAPAQLQLNWKERTDLNPTLPRSIQVFEANEPALPLTAWYARADLRDTSWSVQALLSNDSDGRETVSDFARAAQSWIAINSGYFGTSGNTTSSFSLVLQNGEVRVPNIGALNRSGVTFYPTRSAFGLNAQGQPDIAWVYDIARVTYAYPLPSPNQQNAPQPQPSATFPAGGAVWPVLTAMGGGPVLVENGVQRITWENEVFFGSGIGEITDRNPRTAMGYTSEQHLLLLVVDGRQIASRGASLIELAQIMIALGAVEAMNFDGGGSSTFVARQTLLNKPSDGAERQVATALVLAPKKIAPPPDTLGTIIDTGDSCCYREQGAWFESANPPYWSTSKSRLHAVGSGTGRAVFIAPHLVAGRYELFAWWVAASNRAANTPFQIFHLGEDSTVRVEQRDLSANGQWRKLGAFDLSAGDSIVVTNAATGSTAPAYVCVDAIRLVRTTSTAVVTTAAVPAKFSLHVFPNPTQRRAMLRYDLPQSGWVEIQIVDMFGRTLRAERVLGNAGANHLQFDARELASGQYLVRVQSHDRVATSTITLTK